MSCALAVFHHMILVWLKFGRMILNLNTYCWSFGGGWVGRSLVGWVVGWIKLNKNYIQHPTELELGLGLSFSIPRRNEISRMKDFKNISKTHSISLSVKYKIGCTIHGNNMVQ